MQILDERPSTRPTIKMSVLPSATRVAGQARGCPPGLRLTEAVLCDLTRCGRRRGQFPAMAAVGGERSVPFGSIDQRSRRHNIEAVSKLHNACPRLITPSITMMESDVAHNSQRSLLKIASELLSIRIQANGAGYAHPETFQELPIPDDGAGMDWAAWLATVAAVHELLWTSTRAGFGEEHQTASLMGHLASSLGWFALACAGQFDPADFQDLSTIMWAHQSKTEEASSGVDFGIVAGRMCSNDQPTYNIAMFQAKKAKQHILASKLEFAVDQPIRLRKKDTIRNRNPNDPLFRELVSAAKNVMSTLSDDDAEALLATEMLRPAFQIEALIRTYLRGNLLADKRGEWCHYVLWPVPIVHQAVDEDEVVREPVPMPRAVSLTSVTGSLDRPSTRCEPMKETSIVDVIYQVLSNGGSGAYIEVGESGLKTLVKDAAELLPGLHFVGTGDAGSSGGLIEAFNAAGLEVDLVSPSACAPWQPEPPGPKGPELK